MRRAGTEAGKTGHQPVRIAGNGLARHGWGEWSDSQGPFAGGALWKGRLAGRRNAGLTCFPA